MIDWKIRQVLAFFAHPDDETLAMGATIHRLSRSGFRVSVAIPFTGVHARSNKGQESRLIELVRLRADCCAALDGLGVSENDVILGEFRDNEADAHTRLELVHWLERVMEEVKPGAVFTHHFFCTNVDHRRCHEAAVVATRPGFDFHVPVYCGEVPSSTGYLRPARWEPNLYVELTEADVEAKVKAMQAYAGEVRPDPHPRSPEVLRALAKVRGSEAGFKWAEAFMVQREFL